MMQRAGQTCCHRFAVKDGLLPFSVGIHIVCFPIILELFSDATASLKNRTERPNRPTETTVSPNVAYIGLTD